jgi:hypothetical protein
MAAPGADLHPVRLVVTDDLGRSRLTVLFRALLVIPHFLWLGLFSIVVVVTVIVNWFATLVSGRSPEGVHDFLAGYVRYATHVFAYLFLAANPYPKFYLGSRLPPYPIDLDLAERARQNRWATGFRLLLAIPALLLAGALAGGGAAGGSRTGMSGGISLLAAMETWFSALVRGRAPRGLRDFLAWAVGYTAQAYAYLFLLTDRYPHSGPLTFLRELEPPEAEGRARVVDTDEPRRSRLTVFFRLPLAVPHLAWLLLWTVPALLAAIVNWLWTLVAARPPDALARFLGAYVRYAAHVTAFLYLVGNLFPGFVGKAGSYPVDVRIEPSPRQNRWIAAFRFVLVLPAMLLAFAVGNLLFLVAVFGWFVGLFLGRMPHGLQTAGAYAIGYNAQVHCYLFALTDRYPHSSPLVVLERS